MNALGICTLCAKHLQQMELSHPLSQSESHEEHISRKELSRKFVHESKCHNESFSRNNFHENVHENLLTKHRRMKKYVKNMKEGSWRSTERNEVRAVTLLST